MENWPTQYRHLFFDLDYTLYDFAASSLQTLEELYDKFRLKDKGIPSRKKFIEQYHFRNEKLWDDYRKGNITRNFLRINRWIRTLNDFGITDKGMAIELSDAYLDVCSRKSCLMDGTVEVLERLARHYPLHLITNGFDYVQRTKLKVTGLEKYFQVVVTSEETGCLKPDKAIFEFAMKEAGARAEESVYIGDNWEVDILGARRAGMGQVLYNPKGHTYEEAATYEISSLPELLEIFLPNN